MEIVLILPSKKAIGPHPHDVPNLVLYCTVLYLVLGMDRPCNVLV